METDERIQEIARRIAEHFHPDKIILFGSHARGEAGSGSDVDLLVVASGDIHRGRMAEEIYRRLRGAGVAVDVIVAKPEDIERYGDCPYGALYPALREGRVHYGA